MLIRDYEISQHFVNNGDELIQYLLKVIGWVCVCTSQMRFNVTLLDGGMLNHGMD